jgi:acetyltransferase EpsM
MQDLLLFPYSGTALEAIDCLGDQWNCVGFISDNKQFIGQEHAGIKIFDRSAIYNFIDAKVLAVHGSPSSYLKRSQILASLNIPENRFATVIHPKASVAKMAFIGVNVLIMAGVVITANAVIGNHVVILPNSVIHHDSEVGELTLIAANCTIAGNVKIYKNCYVGAGCSIKNGVAIQEKTLVGMGANVLNSFNSESVLVGNPAKLLKK